MSPEQFIHCAPHTISLSLNPGPGLLRSRQRSCVNGLTHRNLREMLVNLPHIHVSLAFALLTTLSAHGAYVR